MYRNFNFVFVLPVNLWKNTPQDYVEYFSKIAETFSTALTIQSDKIYLSFCSTLDK